MCMLFANDIVLVDKTRERKGFKLDRWRETLDYKEFRISRMKTKYMKCSFSKRVRRNECMIQIDGQEIP